MRLHSRVAEGFVVVHFAEDWAGLDTAHFAEEVLVDKQLKPVVDRDFE